MPANIEPIMDNDHWKEVLTTQTKIRESERQEQLSHSIICVLFR